MTDRQPPEDRPFAEFYRQPAEAQPLSRRAAREAQRAAEEREAHAAAGTGRGGPAGEERVADAYSDQRTDERPMLRPRTAQRAQTRPTGFSDLIAEHEPAAVGASASFDGWSHAEGGYGDPPDESSLFADYGHAPDPPKKRRRRGLVAILVVLTMFVVLGGVGTALFLSFQPQIEAWFAKSQSEDYQGAGTGQVNFVIADGDVGEMIGDKLEAADIIKSSSTFYQLLLKQSPSPVFQPGTYSLANQMSAQAALDALTNGQHLLVNTITIPEGKAAADVLTDLASVTGIPLDQFQAAAADYATLGVPADAPGIEGFLFPATYTFQPGDTPAQILKTMVDRTFESLDAAGVATDDRFRVITLASIVQREAGLAADYPKVSRVFLNRLEEDWLLQSDATVAYGTGNTHTVETTSAERADSNNPYNTYVHEGLPRGPIGNPGDVAIDAAIHPADGPWMYFVTWNLDTGETIFSTTEAEHDAAVEKWREWMDEHGY